MKKTHSPWTIAGILAAGMLSSGCTVVRQRTVVVHDPAPPGAVVVHRHGPPPPAIVVHRPGHVVRVLPPGYRVRRYRGVAYYDCGGVVYRPHHHGFVVVHRPW